MVLLCWLRLVLPCSQFIDQVNKAHGTLTCVLISLLGFIAYCSSSPLGFTTLCKVKQSLALLKSVYFSIDNWYIIFLSHGAKAKLDSGFINVCHQFTVSVVALLQFLILMPLLHPPQHHPLNSSPVYLWILPPSIYFPAPIFGSCHPTWIKYRIIFVFSYNDETRLSLYSSCNSLLCLCFYEMTLYTGPNISQNISFINIYCCLLWPMPH